MERVTVAKERTKLRVGGYMIEFERDLGIVVKWEPEAPDLVMGSNRWPGSAKPWRPWRATTGWWTPARISSVRTTSTSSPKN